MAERWPKILLINQFVTAKKALYGLMMLKTLVFLLCFFPALCFSAADLYPFTSKTQAAQFNQLTHELRCLVCQNQNLAESNAPLAKDFRAVVYKMTKAGKTQSEVTDYLVDRYGDFILFAPPIKPSTWLLWFGPFGLLLLVCGIVFYRKRQT